MKIKYIRPAATIGYAYTDGDTIDCEKAFGMEMIESGFAIQEDDRSDTDFPADFPGRKQLEDNGFRSINELDRIANVESLVEIKGIGKTLAQHIVNAYQKIKK